LLWLVAATASPAPGGAPGAGRPAGGLGGGAPGAPPGFGPGGVGGEGAVFDGGYAATMRETIAGLPEPPEDLADVVKELSKLGIKSVRLASQTVVNGTSGSSTSGQSQFEVTGSVTTPVAANVVVSGSVQDDAGAGLQSRLQIDVRGPASSRGGAGGGRSLCNISTNIATPPNHFVVLGVTPTDWMTSIFVVQVSPSGKVDGGEGGSRGGAGAGGGTSPRPPRR
jgi:hypothetical protein